MPAIADQLILADADQERFSGQALLIQLLNAKLGVLTTAWQDM